jgi:hypothetical protein
VKTGSAGGLRKILRPFDPQANFLDMDMGMNRDRTRGRQSRRTEVSMEQPDAFLVVESRLVIHRGYADSPFTANTFIIDVGHSFSSQLVQLIPIPKAGKSCKVKRVTTRQLEKTNQVEVTFDVENATELSQLAYTLFVT